MKITNFSAFNIGETNIIKGLAISPGITEGSIYLHDSLDDPISPSKFINQNLIDEEVSFLDLAIKKISEDLIRLTQKVEKEVDYKLSLIFEAHRLILVDSNLRSELIKEISCNLMCASSAVKIVFMRLEKQFLKMKSQINKDKAEDMHDISNRLCNALDGVIIHPFEEIPPNSILATSHLMPSDTVFLPNLSTKAILLEFGGTGSHTALFIREMGLPCISGLPNLKPMLFGKKYALVNAYKGLLTFDPTKAQLCKFRKIINYRNKNKSSILKYSEEPAMTKDGVRINVQANISSRFDTDNAIKYFAEGIGLYRMEKIFMKCIEPPLINFIIEEMRHTLEKVKKFPINIRLLDIGGDKPLKFLKFLPEPNPSLGLRGIRLLLKFPTLLEINLRAILELSEEYDVAILVPMVTLPDDIITVKNYLIELCLKMDIKNIPKLGAMIETPAAALSAFLLSKHVDFFSFGTNDLTQYAFAADRDNPAIDNYYKDASKIIFRLIQIVHNDVPNMPLSICGELAGKTSYIPNLLRCGIRTLSVAPSMIPSIKKAIRNTQLVPEK